MFELFERLKHTKRIGFTCGTFDVLHPGHVMMFEESRSHCDYLIVGLLSDPTISRPNIKNKPIQSMWERYVQLQSIKVIDYIIPWDTEDDLVNILEMIRPHIRFVGEEYKDKQFTGKDLCNRLDIEIYYNRRSHKYSSTELRNRMPEPINKPGYIKNPRIDQLEHGKDCKSCKGRGGFITAMSDYINCSACGGSGKLQLANGEPKLDEMEDDSLKFKRANGIVETWSDKNKGWESYPKD